ncbi:hypothetical protein HDV57DRAFT_232420 [Trichoderma longibrachiatum]
MQVQTLKSTSEPAPATAPQVLSPVYLPQLRAVSSLNFSRLEMRQTTTRNARNDAMNYRPCTGFSAVFGPAIAPSLDPDLRLVHPLLPIPNPVMRTARPPAAYHRKPHTAVLMSANSSYLKPPSMAPLPPVGSAHPDCLTLPGDILPGRGELYERLSQWLVNFHGTLACTTKHCSVYGHISVLSLSNCLIHGIKRAFVLSFRLTEAFKNPSAHFRRKQH